MFAGGCGRIFEGTPAQMADSLGKLAALPVQTKVYCTHEHTLANLRFASAVESGNLQLRDRFASDSAQRAAGVPTVPTVPSSIGVEQVTNPFLRYRQSEIVDSLMSAGKLDAGAAPLADFTALREWKNTF